MYLSATASADVAGEWADLKDIFGSMSQLLAIAVRATAFENTWQKTFTRGSASKLLVE